MTVADVESNKSMSKPALTFGRRLANSLFAALLAWGVFVILAALSTILFALAHPHAAMSPWPGLLMVAIGSLCVVAAVWLLIVAPLALIPGHSMFWSPTVLTFVGAAIRPILVCCGAIYQLRSNPTIHINDPVAYFESGVFFPGIPALIIGGLTGLFCAILHRRSQG